MKETMNLENSLKMIKKRLMVIVGTTLVGGLIALLFVTFAVKPQYNSKSQLYVKMSQNETQTINSDAISSSLMLINTYKDMIHSPLVLDESANQLAKANHKVSAGALKEMIKVNQTPNSQIFTLTASASNAKLAKDAVNTVAKVFKEKSEEVMKADKVSIITNGVESKNPVSTNKKTIPLVGLVLGLVAGLGYALVRELFEK